MIMSSMTNNKKLKVLDLPGLDECTESDIEHIKNMVTQVKEETKFIKLFCIVINGHNRSGQKSTLDTVACFENVFGVNFW